MTNNDKIILVAAETSSGKCYLPARFVLTFLLFLAMCLEYAHRFCLSVAIVVMVNHTDTETPNATTEEDGSCPVLHTFNETDTEKQGDYDWSPSIQGVILGAYFYGYVCSQIAGGRLSELSGGKWPLGLSILIGSLLTLITPLAADIGVGALVVVRATMGLLHGVCLPTTFAIFAHWSPVEERSTLLSVGFIGNLVGTVISMSLAGYLCDHDFMGGWPSVFYIFGMLGCIWFVFWTCLIYNKPSDHPRISEQEKDYIQKGYIQMFEDQKHPVPWSKVLRSMPVWSAVISCFCSNWGATVLLTKLPTYLEVVLHVPIEKNGRLNSLIYICGCITLFFSGYIADYLRSQKGFSNTKVRKGFQLIASLGPAILTALIPISGCQDTYVILLLIFVMVFHGMAGGGQVAIAADMAPQYAATIFGVVNGIGSISGIFAPLVAGLILDNAHASIEQWSLVFYSSTMLYMVGALVFFIWASGERQSWAYIPQKNQLLTLPGSDKDLTIDRQTQDDREKR